MMNHLRLRRLGAAVLVLGLLAAGLLAAAGLSAGRSAGLQSAGAASGTVHVRFNVQRFQVDRVHRRLVANGNIVATYRSNGRVQATTTKRTTLSVRQTTSNCSVLHLELGELRLQLLGLIVSLTPVNANSIVLDISANPNEALGKLFCQVLAAVQGASTTTTTKATATRKLSMAVVSRYRQGVMNLDVPVRSQQSATTTGTTTTTTGGGAMPGQCEVLDLILGPLNLDLLGLVVRLNQVELNVSANPTGTLGTLFCQLAGTTTTSTTTTVSTT
jgi:hypothetical protein